MQTTPTSIDFIGDIHGHTKQLIQLLTKLGYLKTNGYYQHPTRKAFFVGDFIDRGPQIKELIDIVRPMIENGAAYAVIGNHEYNAICYWTEVSGKFLREHSDKHIGQHQRTIDSFSKAELADVINWFKTLPIYFESESFRVVHAQWNDLYVQHLKGKNINNFEDLEFLIRTTNKELPEYKIVDTLLKGQELEVPDVFFLDKDENRRNSYRLKWWITGDNINPKEALFGFPENERSLPIENLAGYALTERPVFFGHYWLNKREPVLQQKNVCCLDFSVAKDGIMACYQWDGEQTLDANKFVWV